MKTNDPDPFNTFVTEEENSILAALIPMPTKTEALNELETQTCFAAGTLVHTKEGLKPIEEIEVGDWVLSFPENEAPPIRSHAPRRLEHEYTYRQVIKTFVKDDQPIARVSILDATNGIEETLSVTPSHPIYVTGAGWTPAGQLTFGNALETKDFANLMLLEAKSTNETARVYNIEVDEFHTYYVTQLGVWVHNQSQGVVPNAVRN